MAWTPRAKLSLDSFLLRSGTAIVLFYAAFSAYLNPGAWASFVPAFIGKIIPVTVFLNVWGVYEILLAFWLLSGWQPFRAAVVASITMFLITVFNVLGLDIVFRDVAILLSTIALAVIHYKNGK